MGPCVVDSLRKSLPEAFLDCHLMVSHPENWVAPFKKAGASGFTFHIETVDDDQVQSLLQTIKDTGMRTGIAIKPKTDLQRTLPLIRAGLVDMVLIMTVEPGFGGQSFQESTLSKVQVSLSRFKYTIYHETHISCIGTTTKFPRTGHSS
jgi:ribulose-phosphate 3-epimerase